ncbi:MAG: hypothetical protein EA412_05295 [Chitinophagaceae bacterium]|nr:MAG: hypothetical protein EA412_05295 [Chitinophagaceae bacterium]
MVNKILINSLLVCLILFSSCKKDESKPHANIEWIKIDVPNASTIHSLSGNIENELIAGGLSKIFKTSNQGNTWTVVHDGITAYELRKKEDTLFAIALYNHTYNDYFSLDNGETWQLSPEKSFENLRTNIVTASNGIIYKILRSETYPKQPDKVLMSSDGGSTWIDIFPYKRYIYTIYLDDDDRLYIGANGWEWNEDINSFDSSTGNNKGIIYYIK